MARYFLAPRSGETSYKNFLSTLEKGVSYLQIEQYLAPEGREILSKQETIYAWGNREGRRTAWERMTNGDIVIFYSQGNFISSGELIFKQASDELALAMWPRDENGNPWKYTFFLKNIKHFKLPLKIFNLVSGYNMTAVMGFMEISSDRVSQILKSYRSVEELFNSFGDKETEVKEELEIPQTKVYINLPSQTTAILRDEGLVEYKQSNSEVKRSKRTGQVDFDEIHRRNSNTGSKGEELVLRYEKQHLISIGRSDLANKVKRVSLENVYLGYDILSFEDDGIEKKIEVKTSVSPWTKQFRFHMSSNERTVAEHNGNYYVYLVFDVNGERPIITRLKDPLKGNHLIWQPTQFRVLGQFNS